MFMCYVWIIHVDIKEKIWFGVVEVIMFVLMFLVDLEYNGDEICSVIFYEIMSYYGKSLICLDQRKESEES